MTIDKIITILSEENCSLVVRNTSGEISTYNKRGVRDLIWLLDNEPEQLIGADIADKIVGKAAAGLIVNANVNSLYAVVISKPAIDVLNKANITYRFNTLVDKIVVPEGDSRCRLEDIVKDATSPIEIELMLRQHFNEMQTKTT